MRPEVIRERLRRLRASQIKLIRGGQQWPKLLNDLAGGIARLRKLLVEAEKGKV